MNVGASDKSMEPRPGPAFSGPISFLRAPFAFDLSVVDAEIAIYGAPSDEGSPWMPGARLAPRTIREMSVRNLAGRAMASGGQHGYYVVEERQRYLEREIRNAQIVDVGDAEVIYGNLEATFSNISEDIRRLLERGALPVVLGGDHAVSYPVVRGYSSELDVIHFDAHLDYAPFRHGVTFYNGNPFRLIGELPHVRRISQVGIRGVKNREEDVLASEARGNRIITTSEFRASGPSVMRDLIREDVPLYVSIDIDVLDMPLVPGCSSAEAEGLTYGELREAIAIIADNGTVAGFDVVEVNPMLDNPAKSTSLLAAQLVQEFLGKVTASPTWRKG